MLLRTVLFYALLYGSAVVLFLALLPVAFFWRAAAQFGLRVLSHLAYVYLRAVASIRWEVRGWENVPSGPCVFACKHQSAWETGLFYVLHGDPSYVMKKELQSVPLFGQFLTWGGSIAIDREGGASAVKRMIRQARTVVNQGRCVVIFPEGSRSNETYLPGVAALYRSIDAPIVPVALNSGLFWPKHGLLTHPGRIIVEFLEPMSPALDKKSFMKDLQVRVDAKTEDLCQEASHIE